MYCKIHQTSRISLIFVISGNFSEYFQLFVLRGTNDTLRGMVDDERKNEGAIDL